MNSQNVDSIILVETGVYEMPQPLGLFAGELFDRGKDYHEAFQLLGAKGTSFARYFLAAHALEVFLKSFLATKGIPKRELWSRTYGHDLVAILKRCEDFELPTLQHLNAFTHSIYEMNRDQDFRYPTSYNLRVPSPRLCLEQIGNLAKAIEPIIHKSRFQAQLKFATDTNHLQGSKIRWSD